MHRSNQADFCPEVLQIQFFRSNDDISMRVAIDGAAMLLLPWLQGCPVCCGDEIVQRIFVWNF
jgi:hypothetical protein